MILETYTGLDFDYNNPAPEQIHVPDIARSLSKQARFLGHIKGDFSVADHARLVAELVAQEHADAALELAALHHDSHEAYIGDLPSPLKQLIREATPAYDDMRDDIDAAIAAHLGIDRALFHHPAVKQADGDALYLEARAFKHTRAESAHWVPQKMAWSGAEVPATFLAAFSPDESERRFWDYHKALRLEVQRAQ